MTKENKKLVCSYLLRSPPVLWVSWYSQLADGKAKQALHKVLFDKQDSLRDLQSNIPEEILICAQKHPSILKIILLEINEIIDQVVSKATKKLKQKK